MKKRLLICVVPAIVAALSLAYIRDTPESSDEPETRQPRAEPERAARIDQVTRRWFSADDDDPVIDSGHGSAIEPEPGAKDCTVVAHYLPREDGTAAELYSCESNLPDAEHAYESYSNDALASLAFSDAKAAEILGMRLRDEDEEAAMSLIFRASALSGGNADPILAFSNAYPHPSSIDDVPVRKTVHKKFVMSAVADMLGAPVTGLDFWEDRIREWSSDPEKEIAVLHTQARKIVDEMRQIQLDITGSSNIGGQDDA